VRKTFKAGTSEREVANKLSHNMSFDPSSPGDCLVSLKLFEGDYLFEKGIPFFSKAKQLEARKLPLFMMTDLRTNGVLLKGQDACLHAYRSLVARMVDDSVNINDMINTLVSTSNNVFRVIPNLRVGMPMSTFKAPLITTYHLDLVAHLESINWEKSACNLCFEQDKLGVFCDGDCTTFMCKRCMVQYMNNLESFEAPRCLVNCSYNHHGDTMKGRYRVAKYDGKTLFHDVHLAGTSKLRATLNFNRIGNAKVSPNLVGSTRLLWIDSVRSMLTRVANCCSNTGKIPIPELSSMFNHMPQSGATSAGPYVAGGCPMKPTKFEVDHKLTPQYNAWYKEFRNCDVDEDYDPRIYLPKFTEIFGNAASLCAKNETIIPSVQRVWSDTGEKFTVVKEVKDRTFQIKLGHYVYRAFFAPVANALPFNRNHPIMLGVKLSGGSAQFMLEMLCPGMNFNIKCAKSEARNRLNDLERRMLFEFEFMELDFSNFDKYLNAFVITTTMSGFWCVFDHSSLDPKSKDIAFVIFEYMVSSCGFHLVNSPDGLQWLFLVGSMATGIWVTAFLNSLLHWAMSQVVMATFYEDLDLNNITGICDKMYLKDFAELVYGDDGVYAFRRSKFPGLTCEKVIERYDQIFGMLIKRENIKIHTKFFKSVTFLKNTWRASYCDTHQKLEFYFDRSPELILPKLVTSTLTMTPELIRAKMLSIYHTTLDPETLKYCLKIYEFLNANGRLDDVVAYNDEYSDEGIRKIMDRYDLDINQLSFETSRTDIRNRLCCGIARDPSPFEPWELLKHHCSFTK